jgi:short-subunit dehydrogenase
LVLVGIENANSSDPKRAIKEIEAAGIDHVDVVVANSAISIGGGPLEAVDPQVLTESFNINVVSNLTLFQALHKLLMKSSAPKWVSISSRGGSTAAPLPWYPYAAAYCMSKAAQNWFSQYDVTLLQECSPVKLRLTGNALAELSTSGTSHSLPLRSIRGKLFHALIMERR